MLMQKEMMQAALSEKVGVLDINPKEDIVFFAKGDGADADVKGDDANIYTEEDSVDVNTKRDDPDTCATSAKKP